MFVKWKELGHNMLTSIMPSPPLTPVHRHKRWRCVCRNKSLLEAFMQQNAKPSEFLSCSPVSLSAGKPLASTSQTGKVTFCKRCQDVGRQMHLSTFCLFFQMFLYYLFLSLSHTHTCTTPTHTHTGLIPHRSL